MASSFDTIFRLGALPTALSVHGETVTYRAIPTVSGGTATTTNNVNVLAAHQADLSPATQQPFQQRVYLVPTATIASPQRGDQITDADSVVWVVVDVRMPRGGLTYCQCRIGQVRA